MTTFVRCLLLLSILGLLTAAIPSRTEAAAQEEESGVDASPSRRIVRVISTNEDGQTRESDARERPVLEAIKARRLSKDHDVEFIFIGEDANGPSVFESGFLRKRGFLGVQTIDLTRELRLHFGAPADAGVMISKVLKESPATDAKLEPGDILLAVDGDKLESSLHLERTVLPLADQTGLTLEILRGGSTRTVQVTISERERPSIDLGRLAMSSPGEIHELAWVGPGEIKERVIRIDPKGLGEALRELEVRIEKPDFAERFGSLGQSRLDLQRRIQELEARLQSLERQLQEFSNN